MNVFLSVLVLSALGGDAVYDIFGGSLNKQDRSFYIDHSTDSFLKDGVPFRYISGTIHYFRVHQLDWRDRMQKMKHAGCNVLQTYVEWGSHEPEPGVYDFGGMLNLTNFLQLAQEEDLLVILRPGPYICAERDMGGLPYWLLRMNPDMILRSNDASYLQYVDLWFEVLLPMIEPFLYENGGPIIMVQIENEFGSYSTCDFSYTAHLRDLTKSYLGNNITLFTTDGDSTYHLKCGKIADVYATVDFGAGTNVEKAFESQRLFEPRGPLINSEYYPGWLDHWGDPHATTNSQDIASTLDEILAFNASVNIYVFYGGTNFGLKSGANLGDSYQACPTSYDYDAPLTEAGDLTEKFYAIRNVTQKYTTLPPGPIPGSSAKYAYGDCDLVDAGNLFEMSPSFNSTWNRWPLSFEQLSYFNGLVIYQTKIPQMIPDPARLSLYETHDRGYVYIDDEMVGIVSRELNLYEFGISARVNQTLTIIVESQGRIGYGSGITDFKGILTNVTLGSLTLENWTMTPVPLDSPLDLKFAMRETNEVPIHDVIVPFNDVIRGVRATTSSGGMNFFTGNFEISANESHPMDTFLRLDGWTKGFALVNDFLLGRYWPVVGPQVTLYIPHGVLLRGTNSIIIFELEKSPCNEGSSSCKVTLVDQPEIDGPTPQK